MALPALISGSDCGPLNPLQSLSKQFDKDRGAQQDHFGPGRAGPSREIFRTHSAPAPALHEEAARFFYGRDSSAAFAQHVVPESFDLSSLRSNLPQQPILQSPPSPWAGDFLNHSTIQPHSHKPHLDFQFHKAPEAIEHFFLQGAFKPSIQTIPVFQGVVSPDLLRSHPDSEPITQAQFPPEEMQQQESHSEPINPDELSRTAGLLVDAVKKETNPKFQNSSFLELMRQFRDKEKVIDGTNVVKAGSSSTDVNLSSTWAQDFTTFSDVKGKGKASVEKGWADTFQDKSRKSVHFGHPEFLVEDLDSKRIEDPDDRYWWQENEEYQKYWNRPHHAEILREAPDWDRLQNDWDRFEATAIGIKPVSVYQFQTNNPHLTGNSSTRNHRIHAQRISSNESILEKEAIVQNDIRNPIAWFELGVKQQENEREAHAIQALQRAVELDSSYLEAWLALAISYTNENDKDGACDAIEHWVRINERYQDSQHLNSLDKAGEKTSGERHQQLIQCLIALARAAPGEVDADIQTALGALLNTSENYPKARDCFRAALAVRPHDWLLYNRVGATLANSGQSGEALWYYHRALELNPAYIRARFNLGISCINMKWYNEAAVHILDALVLQENDASDGGDTRGITSSALWENLRTTCLQLQRPELASLCDSHDLEGFRKVF